MMKKLLHLALFAALAVSGVLAYAGANEGGAVMTTQVVSTDSPVQAIDSTLGSGGHAVMSTMTRKSGLAFTGGGGANGDASSGLVMTNQSDFSSIGSVNNVTSPAAGSMAIATIIVIGTTLLASAYGTVPGAVAATSADKFGSSTAGNYTDIKVT